MNSVSHHQQYHFFLIKKVYCGQPSALPHGRGVAHRAGGACQPAAMLPNMVSSTLARSGPLPPVRASAPRAGREAPAASLFGRRERNMPKYTGHVPGQSQAPAPVRVRVRVCARARERAREPACRARAQAPLNRARPGARPHEHIRHHVRHGKRDYARRRAPPRWCPAGVLFADCADAQTAMQQEPRRWALDARLGGTARALPEPSRAAPPAAGQRRRQHAAGSGL